MYTVPSPQNIGPILRARIDSLPRRELAGLSRWLYLRSEEILEGVKRLGIGDSYRDQSLPDNIKLEINREDPIKVAVLAGVARIEPEWQLDIVQICIEYIDDLLFARVPLLKRATRALARMGERLKSRS
ncbi:MAG: hypothetical protein INR66_26220 [Gordonia polyisoprenivorans]|nr:hypothetical protein [Gordonia polyisoprenivorans]